MPIHNRDVAERFEEMADLLELKEANPFRVRAYRNAAQTIDSLPVRLDEMIGRGGDLSELDGIGEDLAGKIERLVRTGTLPQLEELKDEIPTGLLDVMQVPTLGPKRTAQLARDLGVETLEDVLEAARNGAIRELEGFGEKTEATILEEAERLRDQPERFLYADAEERVRPLLAYLDEQDGVGTLDVAGSYRRGKETVGDIDILVTSNASRQVMAAFVAYEDVRQVISQGKTKSSVRLRGGLQVDLRVVPKKSFGAAFLYFTGSKAHNIKLRKMAINREWKINEYGIFDGEEQKAGKTEEEMYAALGLPLIAPELREDRGEVEAAAEGGLPRLVRLEDLRGDLHAHTRASDAVESIEAMIDGARERGREYLAITDHSEHVGVTQGLDAAALEERITEIHRRNGGMKDFDLLAGIEVDILDEGELALPDAVLGQLDVVVASVHTRFGLSRGKQTRRILKAMENPNVHVLGHPTGRMLGQREGYDVDLEELVKEAADGGWCFELNCQPARLDLDDAHCKLARDHGVPVALGTDAHRVPELDNLRFGVRQARRGWLESGDVLNCQPWAELKTRLRRD
jgi:DNA polymerase (family 10)